MTIERDHNDMDGESIFVPSGTPLSEIPDEFRRLLSADVEAAFAAPDTYFEGLPERAAFREFAEWLTLLAGTGLKQLEVHTSEYARNAVLFRFELPNGMSPAVSLPGTDAELELPDALESVYQIVGGTNHFGWGMAGGVMPANTICSITKMGTWLVDNPKEDPSCCLAFYGTACGDNLCFMDDGTAVWYAHERGDFVKYGTVSEFLAAYFIALSAGTELQLEFR